MNTATSRLVHAPPPATPHLVAPRRRGRSSVGHPTWGDALEEAAPMIDAPAFYGPPIIFVLGPWLLLVLLLIGPFALLLTMLAAVAAAAVLMAAVAAVIASPSLLIRHLHTRRTPPPRPRARQHVSAEHRVSPARLVSPQPKGVR